MLQNIFDRIDKFLYESDRDDFRRYLKSLQGEGWQTTTIFDHGWVYLQIQRSGGEHLTFNGPTNLAEDTIRLVTDVFAIPKDAE